ncbi:hypothetical protein [Silvibacterium sp.]|uniref:hypothetical protein n=1 Tax=Silvibacterium sp. TaxID=1964179 RepID=UPI0039E63648
MADVRNFGDLSRTLTRFARGFLPVAALSLFLLACNLHAYASSVAERSFSPQSARDQIAAERHAMRLLARADLQVELRSLEAKWKAQWPQLLPSTQTQAHDSLEELAFLVSLEVVNGDPRRPRVIQISIPPHTWFQTKVSGGRWGIDNPDTQYFLVPVEANSSYVIRGQRHAPGPIDSNFSFSNLDGWRTLANIGQKQLEVKADGSYEITLDNTPAGDRSNHIQLTEAGNALLIRNTLADWSKENVDSIEVRRVSGPPPEKEQNDTELERRIVVRLRNRLDHIIAHLQAPVLALPPNELPQPGRPGDKAGFLVTQRNALGHFRLGSNQGLIVTLNPGGASYCTLPVSNVWGVTPDYWDHQSSLNNRQAVANADGTITFVVSSWDPGVANWVDAAGLEEGIIMLRWQGLRESGDAAGPSVIRTAVVTRDTLKSELPAGIATLNAAERKSQLRSRRAAFERRFEVELLP